jgi:hypothetical protein
VFALVRAASPIRFIALASGGVIANELLQGSQSPGQVVDEACGGVCTPRVKCSERDGDADYFGIAWREVASSRWAIPQQRIRRPYQESVRVVPFETRWRFESAGGARAYRCPPSTPKEVDQSACVMLYFPTNIIADVAGEQRQSDHVAHTSPYAIRLHPDAATGCLARREYWYRG